MATDGRAHEASLPTLELHPLTPERWADFEALFGDKGGHGGCWCMWWRVANKAYDAGAGNKAAFRHLVEEGTPSGTPVGLLGYDNGLPVGWISLGPRADYGRFPTMTSVKFRAVDETPVWSIVCFFVTAQRRRQGIARAMLSGAIEWARGEGVDMLEAYPVGDAVKPSAATLFMGSEALYRDAGFVEVARHHPDRPIVRLTLRPATGQDVHLPGGSRPWQHPPS
jgi:GNAT superfamily N-acetyltransferase